MAWEQFPHSLDPKGTLCLSSTGAYNLRCGYETGTALMKCLTMVILALSVSFAARVALAADYELFGASSKLNYDAVERFDHKNNKLYHCTASVDAETKKPTAQCTETPGIAAKRPAVEGRNLQSTMTNMFDHVPQGFWQIDRTTGKAEFCTFGSPQCTEVTAK
jgi:hypothetical protein